MTFEEAVKELKALACNNAWSLQYEQASYYQTIQIHAYIADVGHAPPATTYLGAINSMKDIIEAVVDPSHCDLAPEEGEQL